MRKKGRKVRPEGEAVELPPRAGAVAGWRRWLPLVALFLLTVLVHWPAREGAYIWDDEEYLTDNAVVQDWHGFSKLWVPGSTVLYVPMVSSTLWLEHKIWGLGRVGADGVLRGPGYHIDNILLHASNALLLFVILRRLRLAGGEGAAWVAAAIFAAHPVTVESVAWLAERKNVLCGVFLFASLYFNCRWFGIFEGAEKKRRDYGLGLLFFVLAMLSKVAAVILPASMLVMIWWRRGGITWRQIAALAPMAMIGVGMGLAIAHREHMKAGTRGELWDFSATQRVLIAGNAFWFQLGKVFWPNPLMAVYPRFAIEAGKPVKDAWLFAAPAAYAALVTVCTAARKWIGRGTLAAVMLYTVALLPTLGFVSFYTMLYTFVADHYQYFACPVAIVFAVEMVKRGWQKVAGWLAETRRKAGGPEMERMMRLVQVAVCAGVIVPLAAISFGVSHLYSNGVLLWENALMYNPESPVVLVNLGFAKVHTKPVDYPGARALFEQAISKDPTNFRWYGYQSVFYAEMGKVAESAQAEYEAEKRMPEWALLDREADLRRIAAALEGATPRSAGYLEARAAEARGAWDEAIRLYEAELKRDAGNDDAMLRLGYCYAVGKGDVARGIELYRQVLGRHAENADGWLFLGFGLRAAGREAEARDALEKSRSLGGGAVLLRHPEFLNPVK